MLYDAVEISQFSRGFRPNTFFSTHSNVQVIPQSIILLKQLRDTYIFHTQPMIAHFPCVVRLLPASISCDLFHLQYKTSNKKLKTKIEKKKMKYI